MSAWMRSLAPLLLLPVGGWAQDEAPPPDRGDELRAELNRLEEEFREAVQEFFRPYSEAKTDEEREKIELDWEKHPSKDFVPRFLDLAERAKGSPVAISALVWVMQNGMQAGPAVSTEESNAAILERLLDEGIQAEELEQLATFLRYGSWSIGREKTLAALRTMLEKSPHEKVRAAACFSLAAVLTETPAGKLEARQLLERLQKEFAETPQAGEAEAYLFELDHLQIGMVAPDFEATDQDGVKFQLSEYRGKVVVLDFWGFW